MAAGQRGRPNKYYTHIEPRLAEIEKLCINMTESQIAKVMGVGYTAWKQYKKKYPPLLSALKKGRENLVSELKSTLIRKAKGFQYEEKKVIKELNDNNKLVVVREETTIKSSLPDVAAANLLLKNYDRDFWANDPQMIRIREKELELRERQLEKDEW